MTTPREAEHYMTKRAVVTGITGQDGSYLAELLLAKGYAVTGVIRRASAPNLWRIEHLLDRIELRPADLLDQLSIIRLIDAVKPHEFYNLAAMSFVPASWDQPMLTGEFNAQGVTRVLEAIRQVDPSIRLYQASSSEMFGKVREVPQTELTPFYPRSPYGVSKVGATIVPPPDSAAATEASVSATAKYRIQWAGAPAAPIIPPMPPSGASSPERWNVV